MRNAREWAKVFENRRVFITGHTGFKGSWLSAWLTLLGARVTGFALPPEHANGHFTLSGMAGRMRHVEGDIRDARALRAAMESAQPEFVFHLAAQPLVLESYRDPKTTFDTNVGGSVNLLEAVRAAGSVRVLIYVTSDKCYRNDGGGTAFRETDPLGGHDPYSASKACAELLLASYQASFFRTGPGKIASASVRAGNVMGGGDWGENRILPDCIRALGEGRPVVLRNPGAVRPWQHVLDALSGYLQLASRLSGPNGSQYEGGWNFGPDDGSHRSVADLVGAVFATWGSAAQPVETPGTQGVEASRLYLDCGKARQLLGWRPAWNFEESVKRTVDWYRAAGGAADAWRLTAAQIEAYSMRMDADRKHRAARESVA